MGARDSIRRRGGLAATFELHEDGMGQGAIRHAISTRSVLRVRQGWYADPTTHGELIRAARVGGRATCSTALALRGVWVVGDDRLHVAVEGNSCQLRNSRDKARRLETDPAVRVHWSDRPSASRSRLIVGDIDALADYAHCATPELVGAAAESLLHERPGVRPALLEFVRHSPAELRRVLATVDGVSESGTEFLVRWRLARRIPGLLRPQVEIPRVGRVDFVVGERLVIEVDGREYHIDPARFEDDRRRDASLSILGYRVLRFSYRQVMFDWPVVEGAVFAAIARGDQW